MLLQPILFPDKKYSIEPELFFHGTSDGRILAGSTVSLESYFNAFSIGKWREYTDLDNLYLQLEIKGDVEIRAYHAVGEVDEEFPSQEKTQLPDEEYIEQVNRKAYKSNKTEILSTINKNGDIYTIQFDKLYASGILYVSIFAKTDSVLYGGCYCSDVDENQLSNVKIALGICTFRREEELHQNLAYIKESVIDNSESPLFDKLEVYIADNGQTLEKDKLSNDKIHIFYNLNLGGTGGFTRTMIEAMFHDRAKGFTHIIFMDDDILLYPPVLERSFYLLRMLKPKYRKAILGAGMMSKERRYLQQEKGAFYEDSAVIFGKINHRFFDLRCTGSISANEVSGNVNYTAWWYACIPSAIIHEHNLPMPFFVHYDDVEYGMRNISNGLLLLNGICVWHPDPTNKSPFWMAYYDTRNRLITMFTRGVSRRDLTGYLLRLLKKFLARIIRCQYTDAGLILKGAQDFFKGPDDFICRDVLKLHGELLKDKKQLFTPAEVGISEDKIVSKRHPHPVYAIVVQGLCNLLPAKKIVKAINSRYFNIPYRAEKVYLFNEVTGKGNLLKSDRKKFYKLLFSMLIVMLKIEKKYKKLMIEWQSEKSVLTGLSFWKKYLGLI